MNVGAGGEGARTRKSMHRAAESKVQVQRGTRPGQLLLDGQTDRLSLFLVSRRLFTAPSLTLTALVLSRNRGSVEITYMKFCEFSVVSASSSLPPPEP